MLAEEPHTEAAIEANADRVRACEVGRRSVGERTDIKDFRAGLLTAGETCR